ncbi:MAG: mucoidy inhibitor MuiA family protein [Cyanobacteria bacterium NC_groundwater_1444_Ag_S-0.65um_54_12]|nr:mucoidy inhibitor MuiA family protein [Cyanobacteria bacterium NC_groundwater_1444_Ag_S-0.65um_54_12]
MSPCPAKRCLTIATLLGGWLAGSLPGFSSPLLEPPRIGLPAQSLVSQPRQTSYLTSVVVHPDRVRVARTQQVALGTGPQQVLFSDLPSGLDPASVRAAGTGTAQALIAGIEVRTVHLGAPAEANTRDLERRIRELEDRAKDLDDQNASWKLVRSMLNAAANTAGKAIGSALATKSFEPGNWSSLLSFIEQQDQRLAKNLTLAARGKRELTERLELLKRELAALQGFRARERREVQVLLDVTRAGDLALEITYDVFGASWSPSYDIALEPDLVRAKLSYRALVAQQTGEDWTDTRLTLSSGRPDLGVNPPEIGVWLLDAVQPLPERRSLARERSLLEVGEDQAQPSLPRSAPAAPEEKKLKTNEPAAETTATLEATIRTQGTAILLEAARPVTLPGDGRPRHVPIGNRVVAATCSYQVIPRFASSAYLTAELLNSTPWPLLAGQFRAHLGHDYVGSGELTEDIVPGATFSVAFGADRQIKVSRMVLKHLTGARGFIVNKRRRAEYAFKISLTNQKSLPIKLTIMEPLPMTRREDIVIGITGDASLPSAGQPADRVTWQLTLPAAGQKELIWGYWVEWPADLSISGLE